MTKNTRQYDVYTFRAYERSVKFARVTVDVTAIAPLSEQASDAAFLEAVSLGLVLVPGQQVEVRPVC